MNYCNVKPWDIADGIGVRVSLFVSGCTHRCRGCFQPETWDFDFGEPFTREVEDHLMECLSHEYIDGLTLLGGEPFEPANQRGLLPFLRRLRSELSEKTIWSYSGYTWEELTGQTESRCRCEVTDEMLSMLDILVDGEFVETLRDITLRFRGSRNQRIIEVPGSLKTGTLVLSPLNEKQR